MLARRQSAEETESHGVRDLGLPHELRSNTRKVTKEFLPRSLLTAYRGGCRQSCRSAEGRRRTSDSPSAPGVGSPDTDFLMKIGPKTNGSKHLLVFTEEILRARLSRGINTTVRTKSS